MNGAAPRVPQGLSAFGDWFNDIFRLWSAQWQVWVLQSLIIFTIILVPVCIFYGLFIAMAVASPRNPSASDQFVPLILIAMAVIFIAAFFTIFLIPGMVNTALKQIRGQQISVGDLFSGMRYGWAFFVITLLCALSIAAFGIGLFIVLGLLFLALPLMIDRKMSLGDALVLSWNTASQNFWFYVLFACVATIVSRAGVILCGVGVIATLPFLFIGQAVAYVRTFEGQGTASPLNVAGIPAQPPAYIPPPVGGSPVAQYCPACGHRLPEGTAVCPQCGKQL
ncbi:MAG TPA: zinc-ribbon domain-containing protein [Armatimonadota bacterium]|nr:zinc-ribbon domain-containing protein [Armatimonadota bacterium]